MLLQPVGGDEMRNLGLAFDVKAVNRILNQPIGVCHALVLTEMLEPGFHQEGFHHAAFFGGILEHPPGIGAVAPALLRELLERGEKPVAAFGIDPVFDHDHDQPLVLRDIMPGERRGPVHRRG